MIPTVDTSVSSDPASPDYCIPFRWWKECFISGSEIAWDLDRTGGTTWVDTTLKASYVSDDANTFTVTGSSGSIFNGLGAVSFDDGTGTSIQSQLA